MKTFVSTPVTFNFKNLGMIVVNYDFIGCTAKEHSTVTCDQHNWRWWTVIGQCVENDGKVYLHIKSDKGDERYVRAYTTVCSKKEYKVYPDLPSDMNPEDCNVRGVSDEIREMNRMFFYIRNKA